MRTKFKPLLGVLALSSIVGVAVASNPNNCQKPNPNQRVCIVTPGGVLDCTTVAAAQCAGTKEYQKKLFPDGSVGDAYSGRWTKDVSADCYKYASCAVNPLTSKCENMHGYGNWFPAPKTVFDPSKNCLPPT